MADGDVVIERNFEVDTVAGTRVELFAVEDSTAPGGYAYRFQYDDPDDETAILRYDNAHDSTVGPHHRHHNGEVTGIEVTDLESHLARFRTEVFQLNEQ
ncbi:toxin-antitoxin system TumE family protein [Halonotius sp. GCM10025705]|uniref:toxin-antitoxin system TumE family protein n=1 Tax=Halonotius sp. GCM10025705 TaxID=3252678 RepID=UPI0036156209